MKNGRFRRFLFNSIDARGVIIIRLVVGLIFLSEGIQKFLFPELTGPGRFEKIGFDNPEFWAYFTGVFEIICGTFVLARFSDKACCHSSADNNGNSFSDDQIADPYRQGVLEFCPRVPH